MTLDEAKRVASIACLADGGCCHCVEELAVELQEEFPEFHWEFWRDDANFDFGIRITNKE